MKRLIYSFALASGIALTVAAAPTEKGQTAKTSKPADASKTPSAATDRPIPKSTFGIPTKPEEGRDPFFPTSDRLYAVKTAPKQRSPSAPSQAIVFNGISGSADHRFAMINGRTFAEGEEAPVNTPSGRIKVLLLAIKGNIAVVEIAGERRELTFQDH